MSEIKVDLQETRIVDIQARIDPQDEKLKLTGSSSIQSKKPVDPDDLSGFLSVQVIISSEKKEEFYLSITEEFIFGFDTLPKDFDEIIERDCIPIATEEVSKRIDRILEVMGNSPLKLSLGPLT